ncbi:MAG: hypothetical protein JRF39_14035 [Deltaproteobacteria bacterium]|nr:hypothetical protein [Deltaproteobacteria bacterium]
MADVTPAGSGGYIYVHDRLKDVHRNHQSNERIFSGYQAKGWKCLLIVGRNYFRVIFCCSES